MKNRNGTQVIIKKNGDIHVPILEGEMIEAAPMTLQWPGLLVDDEYVALSLQCQIHSFQMGAATTKILYIVTDNDLYIEREGK
jgi:hypothetical protein